MELSQSLFLKVMAYQISVMWTVRHEVTIEEASLRKGEGFLFNPDPDVSYKSQLETS